MKYFFSILIALLFISTQAAAEPAAENVTEPSAFDEGALSCLLEPSMEVELSSEVTGVLEKVTVQRGDRVKKGQVLISLSSRVERAVLATARAKVSFAKRKVKRNEVLYKKGLLSDHERDEMLTEQRLAELLASESYIRLKQRETKSPISGVVVERYLEPGELVDEEPFMKIVALNPLHAEVVMRSEFYGKIQKGMDVLLFPDVVLGQGYKGTVHLVDPLIDAASGTFAIRVLVPNDELVLPAGLKCRIQFAPQLND
jgi:RND family efflux transporter MFP subunit